MLRGEKFEWFGKGTIYSLPYYIRKYRPMKQSFNRIKAFNQEATGRPKILGRPALGSKDLVNLIIGKVIPHSLTFHFLTVHSAFH